MNKLPLAGIFLKTEFRLISIMVSTIPLFPQYSYIQSFLLMKTIIKTWRPIFKEKRFCSQKKLVFWLVKNSFFDLSDIPGCENSFSVRGKRFFNEFFIPASGNGKSIFLFSALLKLLKFGGGESCFWKLILWLVKLIFPISQILLLVKLFSVQWKRIFKRIIQSVWWRRIFYLVETVFSYLIFLLQV